MSKFNFYKGFGNGIMCRIVNPITKCVNEFETNRTGNGVFLTVYDCDTSEIIISNKQIMGTIQFRTDGLKVNSQKAKIRKFIKNYFKEIWDVEV